MGSLFSRQAAPLLGIDISSSSVKLVELGKDKAGGLVLERCAIEPLERGWITDGNIEKFDEVAEAVRRVVKKSGTRTKNVALALPSSAVITKRITLPGGMTEQELEVQVESEANQYIPFSLDEVSLDFCVIGPSKNSPGDIDVLIAASRREKVQDRQGLAEAAGLKPIVVDIESNASRLAAGRLIEALPGKGSNCHGGPLRGGCFDHEHAGDFERRGAVRPRSGIRWCPAYTTHRPPIWILRGGG